MTDQQKEAFIQSARQLLKLVQERLPDTDPLSRMAANWIWNHDHQTGVKCK